VERGLAFAQLAAGEKHTCGVTTDGKVLCWGDGYSDQLGLGIAEQRRQPDDVSIRQPMTVIAAGRYANCATGPDHVTYCWGRGFGGTPRQVGTDLQFAQLAVGDEFACGLVSGTAWCWGKNNRGQLGDGSGRTQNAPVKVATSQSFMAIAAGNAHACAVTSAGATFCWGDNGKGQIGAGEDRSPVPIEIRR
jgi:alpha-tubulin suppressor-like RCC1 family protein